jgi:rRNA maturation endonuclease Nob1
MGDPACHLSETCLACGRHVDIDRADVCPNCGQPVDGSTTESTR